MFAECTMLPTWPWQSLPPLAEPTQSYRADDTACGQGRGKHLMPCSAHEISPSLKKKRETKPATQLKIGSPLFRSFGSACFFTPPLLFTIMSGTNISVARRSPKQV